MTRQKASIGAYNLQSNKYLVQIKEVISTKKMYGKALTSYATVHTFRLIEIPTCIRPYLFEMLLTD